MSKPTQEELQRIWPLIRDRAIEQGITSVKRDKRMKPHEVRGSIAGFVACREVTSLQKLATAVIERRRYGDELAEQNRRGEITLDAYWEYTYATIQMEHMLEVAKVHFGAPMISGRVLLQYNDIIRELAGGTKWQPS